MNLNLLSKNMQFYPEGHVLSNVNIDWLPAAAPEDFICP